jgi:hypothetical protein
MKDIRQVVLGVLAALFSSVILLGSLTLSLAEGGKLVALIPSRTSTLAPTPTDSPTPPPPPPTTRPGEPTYTPSPTPLPTATPTDSPTPTLLPTAANCPQPDNWKSILVPLGATLYSLAEAYEVTPQLMADKNCMLLTTGELPAGATIYVPRRSPTPTKLACGPYRGWVHGYVIKPGDTLSRLSQIFGVSINQLQVANCLGNSVAIQAGQLFWVPFIPTPVPTRTPARTPTPIPPRTSTPTNPPAVTPSDTPTDQPTRTPRPTIPPTNPPGPTSTATRTAVPTAIPTNTQTPSPTPVATDTPVPTDTPTPSNTPVPTDTPVPPTDTPLPTDTPSSNETMRTPGMALAPV